MNTEYERGGEHMLFFFQKYNDFTCSLNIINYAEMKKFPLEKEKKESIPPFLLWVLADCLKVWVGGNSVCINKTQMNKIPVLNLLLSHCGI